MQKTLKLAAIFFALAQLSIQCGNGCLMCKVPEICDLCDTSNAFVLDNGQCVHKPLQDCLTYNLEGKCLVCKEGLYLNLDQQKCLPIQQHKQVEHCLYYTPQGNCTSCQSKFYLSGSVCAPLETEITNCSIYNSKTTCSECADNYLLSVDQKNCVAIAQDSKCQGYSLNKCIDCNEQSIVDITYYQKIIKTKAIELNKVNQQYIFNYFNLERHYYFETCIMKKVSNCAVFQDFETCIECKKGYYLQDNECKANPQSFIPYCQRYENINKCIECQQGYYLESDVSCKAVNLMDNCILYDTTSNKSQCKECVEKFYLQIDNTCVARTLEVENCTLYNTNNNFCSKCANDMILSTDAKKCLLPVDNCQQYESSNIDTVNIKCFICKPGFYLKNNICEVGDVVNCEIYQTESNVCSQCKNKYYLSGGICKLHGDINNCQVYSQIEAGKCSQCISGSVKFPKITSCNSVVPIEGCLTYSETNKCSQCMDGYNYVSETQCDSIQSGTNCAYQIQGVCQKCNDGYFLDANKICVTPIQYGLEFCDQSTLNDNGVMKCNVCKPNAFSYIQTQNYVCKSVDAAQRSWSVQSLPSNCESFKKDNTNVICTQCVQGYFLNGDNNTCQDNCDGTVYKVKLQDDKTLLKQVCVTTEDNCQVKSLKQTQAGDQHHSCLECKTGFFAKVDFQSTLQVLDFSNGQQRNLYYKPEIGCTDKTNVKVRSKNYTFVDGCEYYYDLHNGEIGCAKCKQGHSGLIKNWQVLNCVTYDAQTKLCTQCLNDYKLEANGLDCTPLNPISNCERYKKDTTDICELCKPNYYLQSANQCTQVTQIQNCEMYQMDQDKCVRCKNGFRFNDTKNVCFEEISKCQTYSNPTTAQDTANCLICEDGYYPIIELRKCEKGNVQNCWRYKQNMVNVCEYYNNNIPFEDQNICTAVNKIEGCSKYSSVDTCETCNDNSHYKSGNTCCPFRYFNNGSKCEQIQISNCKTSTAVNNCDQCLQGFYPDLYQSEVNPPHVCCGQGSYWHPKDLECSSKLDISLNEFGCDLFSETILKCVHCKEGFYLSGNRFCCPLGQYHTVENNKNVCKVIPDTETNCIKYDDTTGKCQECKTFKQGDEFQYFLGPTSKKCCKLNHESDSANGCVANLPGCKTVNVNDNTKCDVCRDEFTLETDKCCAKKTNTQTAQYLNATPACANVTNGEQIENCIYYQLQDGVVTCKECDAQFVLSNSNKTCCPVNKVFVKTQCIDTSFIYQNCIKVDITTNLCDGCATGYYLHNGVCVDNNKVFDAVQSEIKNGDIENCVTYNDTVNNSNTCATCKDGYTLTNNTCVTQMLQAVNDVTYEYTNLITGCAYFNISLTKCEICKGGYYKNTNDIMCCKFGQKLTNGKCVNLEDQDCLTVDAQGVCSSRSKNTVANCKTSVDNQNCTECKFGYFLENNVCKSQTDVNKVCSNFDITLNCKAINSTNCTCTECQTWAYGDHCCQYGQRWNSNSSKCENISEDVHCAQWDSTNNNCSTCFFNTTLNTIGTNYKWQYLNTDKSNASSNESNAYPNEFNIWKDTNNKCCPLYQGIKDSICQYSTINNCRKPIYANSAWTCSECDYGHTLSENKLTCTSVGAGACPTGQYKSNSQCCPDYQYFNKEDSRCHPIIDKNCKQSDEGNKCTIACKDAYSKRAYMESTMAELYIQTRPQGKAYYRKAQVDLCINNADISKYFNYDYAKKIVENCQQMDVTNQKCQTCKDGFYLESGAAMCCANQKALVTLLDNTTVLNGYCYDISKLMDNCTNYDKATKKCMNCKSGFNLNFGRCCTGNTHFNIRTGACDLDSSNCAIFDDYNGVCKLCNQDYHLSNDKCIPNNKYNNDNNNVDVSTVFVNCSEVSNSESHECLNIQASSNAYLHRGRACQQGQYNDGTQCQSISSLGTEYNNCLELNHINKCQNCSTNYYHSNGRCCKDKEYFEPFIKKCIPINKYRNCLEASKDKEGNCQKCNTGYYVGAYGFCVEEGKKITDQFGTIDNITIQDCTQVGDNDQCIQCTGTKVIYDNQCLDYENINAQQRIGECKIIKAGTPPICLECKNNYYLTQENQKCCLHGTYYENNECVSLQLKALNCKIYQYGQCEQCQDGFYLSNNSACCQEGFYAKSASECAKIDLLNCLQSNNNGLCEKCNNGFKLVSGQCKEMTNITNCQIGATDTTCLICNNGFYLNEQNQCVAQDTILQCSQMTSNKNTCATCNGDLYYDGQQCCEQGKYTRVTGVVKNGDNYTCESLQPTTLANCQRINNGECVSCGTDQYLFNSQQCCPYGQYHNGTNCVASTAKGLENCREFKDQNTCKEVLNEKGEDQSCLNSKYFHLGHCCSIDQYWNSTNNQCEANSTVTAYQNCQRLNDQMQCTICSSGYLSKGLCCEEGKYNVSGTCTAIPATSCLQYDGTFCSKCGDSKSLTSFNRCCDQNYSFQNNSCSDYLTNQDKFDIFNEKLISCSTGNYPATDSVCCAQGEYYNAANTPVCTALTNASTCLEVARGGADNTCIVCAQNNSQDQIAFNDDTCRLDTKFILTVGVEVDKTTITTNCLKLGTDGQCTECTSGKTLSQGTCFDQKYIKVTVDANQISTYAEDDIVNLITNCEQLDTTNAKCEKCGTGFFTVPDKSACCADGKITDDNSTCSATDATVSNCIQFEGHGDTFKSKCQTCKSGFNVYVNSDSTIKSCCENQKKPNTDFSGCESFGYNIDKCAKFDHLTNQCLECKPTVANEKYYLSENSICCKEGEYYNATNQVCETIVAATYPDCSQVSSSACQKCTNTTTHYLNSTNNCCPKDQYYNSGGPSCDAITGVQNCQQADAIDDCKVCKDTFVKVIKSDDKYTCCKPGQYYNNTQCTDITADKNCLQVPDKATDDTKCAVCKPGFILAQDTETCCQPNDITGNSCKKTQQLYSTDKLKYCGEWDRKNLSCVKCQEQGYYASNGGCCQEGQYSVVKSDSFSCTTITINNCKKYNDTDGCTQCSAGYSLNKSQSKVQANACVQQTATNGFLGCLTTDNNLTKCLQCDEGYYLHKDKCAPIGQQRNAANNNSENIAVTNCLKMQSTSDTLCEECKNEHYLTKDKKLCCQEGTYLLNGACVTKGGANDPVPVENCAIFEDDALKCTKCKFGYVKGTKQGGAHICLKFRDTQSEELCEEAYISSANNKNTFNCTKCKNHEIDFVLKTTKANRTISYNAIQGCAYYDTQTLLSVSTLNCKVCEDNNKNYLDQGICKARTVVNLDQCQGQIPYEQDICNKCNIGYYLDSNNICQQIPVENCLQYDGTQCVVCNTGFKLMKQDNVYNCVDINTFIESSAAGPSFYKGYIEECQQQNTCQQKIVGGISQTLSRLFSCHLCSSNEMIPFVSIKTTTDNGATVVESIQRYKKPQDGQTQDQGSELNSSQCMKPIGSTFNIPDTQFLFPENCSLGMINSTLNASAFESKSAQANPSNLGVYCVSCQPGYKPFYGQVTHQVYKCESINYCEEKGENFNECQKCQNGYVYKYDTQNNKIQKDSCTVFTSDQNCLAADFNNTPTCKFCKRGYSLNKGGFCEQTRASDCQENKYERLKSDDIIKTNNEELILRVLDGQGCQQCKNDFVKILETNADYFCEYSPVVQSKQVYNTTQVYQSNCLQYDNTEEHKCVKCQEDSVLNIYGTCLDINTSLQNCKLAENQDLCQICDDNFVKLNNVCVVKDIDNCDLYIDNPSDGKKRCSQCQIGYGLENGLCAKDLFNPCVKVDEKGICLNCQFGFQLVTLKNDLKACIEVTTHQNCKSYDTNNFQQFNLKCTACESNQFVLVETSVNEVCNPLPQIKNCQTYDLSSSFSNSTLACLECKSGYYLLANECLPRLKTIKGCLKYQLDSQLCDQCDLEYYLSIDKKQCIENPKGIQHCKEYKSTTECNVCNTQYYVLDGHCKQVQTENLVQMCEQYDNNQTCAKCSSNYILGGNVCESVLASNCLEIENRTTCKSCQFGYKLETLESITSCVKIQKEQIQNCQVVSDTTPFTCLKCQDGYYVLDGQCELVENKIPMCKEYDSPYICAKCDQYSILSADRTTCASLINQNCLQAEEQTEGFCVVCKPGYILENGKCVFMTGSFQKAAENCMVFSDVVTNGKLQCLICQIGYSMNEIGVCSRTDMNNGQTPDVVEEPSTDTAENLMIFSIVNYTLWFFYAFF